MTGSTTTTPSVPRSHHLARILLVAALVGAAAVALRASGIAEAVTVGDLYTFRDTLGVLAPLAYVAIYALGLLVAFPALILSLAGGLLFGTLFGGVLILIGAWIGAQGAFAIARSAGRSTVERFVTGNTLERFDRSIGELGVSAVVFTRIVPIFPFSLVNFAWGLTGVRWMDYAIGTLIGMIPASFILANLSASIARSLEGSETTLASLEFSRLLNADVLLALGLLGLLTAVPSLVRRIWRRSARSNDAPKGV